MYWIGVNMAVLAISYFCRMRVKGWIILTFLLFSGFCHAQTDPFRLGINADYGFLWPHRESMTHLVKGHAKSLEVVWEKPTYSRKEWEYLYNNPTWGVLVYVGDMGNPEQVGTIVGAYPFFKLPLLQSDHTRLNLRFGTGLGWSNKPFDADSNHKNIALGSRLNSTMAIAVNVERQIGKLFISAGLGLTHFSNAAFKMPNLGYNIPQLSLGISYQIGTDSTIVPKFRAIANEFGTIEPVYHDHAVFLTTSFGLREISPAGGKKYTVNTLGAHYAYFLSKKVGLGGGIDLFYNTSIPPRLEEEGQDASNSDAFQIGIHLGFVQQLGKMGVNIQTGYYIRSAFKTDGSIYNRINIRCFISERLFIHGGVKTHLAKADHLELGIGYRIK